MTAKAVQLDGIQRILAATDKYARHSNALRTAENTRRLPAEERERQINVGRVFLESETPLVDKSGLVAEPLELTNEACVARWGKSLDDCTRERIAAIRAAVGDERDVDPETLVAPAHAWLRQALNRSDETWAVRCQRVMARSLADLCTEIHAATGGTKKAVLREAKSRISKTEALALLDAPPADAPLEERFKRWIEVNAGAAQRQIEDRLMAEDPKADPVVVNNRARAEINKIVKKKTSKWLQFFKDDKMLRILQNYEDMGDSDAGAILEHYLAYKVRLESRTQREFENRSHDLLAQRQAREERIADDAEYRRRVHHLLDAGDGRVPHGEADFAPSDAARDPLTMVVAELEDPLTGASARTNAAGDVLSARTQTAAQFLRAYAQDKSDSASAVHQRLSERLAFNVQEAISLHIKFMQVANPTALFAGSEHEPSPSGNTVDDLLALLDSTEAVPNLDGNAVVRYLSEWQRCLVESRIDVDNAVALRHRQYDADVVRSVMAELKMTRAEVEASFAYGVDPETCEVMRRIMWAAENDWFLQSDAQADEKYKHRERIEKIERRTKRRRTAATTSGPESNGTSSTGGAASHSQSRTREELEASDDEAVRRADPADMYTLEAQFKNMALHSRAARRMPIIEADYFPQFMRKGLGAEMGERDCRNGDNCYCAVKSAIYPFVEDGRRRGKDFVCREFLLPAELDEWKVKRQLPTRRGLCVFCEMFMISIEYSRLVRDRVTPLKILHRWAVRIGPGQFNAACMLPVAHEDRWTGVVRPFPRMNANNYVYGETDVGKVRLPCMRPTDRLDFRLTSNKRMRI